MHFMIFVSITTIYPTSSEDIAEFNQSRNEWLDNTLWIDDEEKLHNLIDLSKQLSILLGTPI